MTLREKIVSRRARVGVMGLGYVGLPLAVEMGKAGYHVTGIDVDDAKVARLRRGESYVLDVPDEDIHTLVDTGRFEATTDFSALADLDAVSICVPTPLRKTKEPDISYIVSAVDQIKRYMHRDFLIILESTTYPGTTEELILQELEGQGWKAGQDFYLCFSPERVDPGNAVYTTRNTPKVIGGTTPRCTEMARLFYGSFLGQTIPVSSTRVAEMVKLLENTFRSVNIALVNEIAIMCDRMGIDVWEVIDAAATKPFGFMPFYPGPGIGGHCIPLDPIYLSWKAKTFGLFTRFIDLASDINSHMPGYVVNKIGEALNRHRKPVNGSRILLLGMSYKKDVNDTRESPSIEIYDKLVAMGAEVNYNDPYVPSFITSHGEVIRSVPLSQNVVAGADCVVLCTDHSVYDYEGIAAAAQLIVDTRNGFKGVQSDNIVKLGAPPRVDRAALTSAERPVHSRVRVEAAREIAAAGGGSSGEDA